MTASRSRDTAHRTLKRLLANGPLTVVPTRPSDQDLLVALAASRFKTRSAYCENEVNEKLKAWLGTFCAPFGIDHVTFRRMMVDSRLMSRTKSGSMYRVNPERVGETDALRSVEPGQVLAEVLRERETRKRLHSGLPKSPYPR